MFRELTFQRVGNGVEGFSHSISNLGFEPLMGRILIGKRANPLAKTTVLDLVEATRFRFLLPKLFGVLPRQRFRLPNSIKNFL